MFSMSYKPLNPFIEYTRFFEIKKLQASLEEICVRTLGIPRISKDVFQRIIHNQLIEPYNSDSPDCLIRNVEVLFTDEELYGYLELELKKKEGNISREENDFYIMSVYHEFTKCVEDYIKAVNCEVDRSGVVVCISSSAQKEDEYTISLYDKNVNSSEALDKLYIQKEALEKLYQQFIEPSFGRNSNFFCDLVYILLKRNECIVCNMHASIPTKAMCMLKGATTELFASPTNRQLPIYYSAMSDIDPFFGSRGSFFEAFKITEACTLQCNPPFSQKFVSKAGDTIIREFQRLEKENLNIPVTVIFIVPHYMRLLKQYEFLFWRTNCVVLKSSEHSYEYGHKYRLSKEKHRFDVKLNTCISVLQNKAAIDTQQFTAADLQEFVKNMKT